MHFKGIKHFCLVMRHRHQVIRNGFHLGIFFVALFHDFSKFTPSEFIPSVKYFKGTSSPVQEQRNNEDGYSTIAVNHTSRNKHHWEHYIDIYKGQILVKNIPYKYALEYVADMMSASKTYDKAHFSPDAVLTYFMNKKDMFLMSDATKEFISWCFIRYKEFNGFKGLKPINTRKKYEELIKLYPPIKSYKIDMNS
jgi:hypothetical protein